MSKHIDVNIDGFWLFMIIVVLAASFSKWIDAKYESEDKEELKIEQIEEPIINDRFPTLKE